MGSDLFNACVFCAATLLNVDFAAPKGYLAEVVGGYSTLQRQLESGSTAIDDRSDVTAKFAAVGMRWVRPAEGDLGAGTPASEWRMRYAFPTSHDEASQSRRSPLTLTATGSGRYENFLGSFRKSVGEADSIELAYEHRRHKITDLLNIGSVPFQFTHERDLIAEHIDFGLGWRHRWRNLELAGAFTGSRFEGKTETPPSFVLGDGTILGGRLELRARRGAWTASLLAQAVSGNLRGTERYGPTSQAAYQRPAHAEALTLSLQRRVGKVDIFLSGQLDRSRLPLVSLAVLGSEQLAFDQGYHPDSRTKQLLLDLAFRHEAAPGVYTRFFFRFVRGSETVTLTDTAGVLPPLTLQLIRGGKFPPVGANPTAPEFSIGFGIEAVLGLLTR
jgi:hypothetical protein